MPWYKAGTVSVTQNSNAVIGAGTAFIANSRVGDAFRGPDGGWYEVTNIASDTALSISPNYQGATASAGAYALAPMQGYVKDSADTLRALVNQFGAQLAALTDSDGLPEGANNKYFTDARVRAVALMGFVTSDGAPVVAGDTVLAGLGKLQAQVTARLPLAGGKMTGAINDATPVAMVSAATVDIGAAASNVITISGTTTITGFGAIAAGARRTVRFLSALVLTHNATSLILPAGANIAISANDTAEFVSLGGGNWLCLRYNLANGKALAKDFAYDRSSILGTVSQSAGVPNGAIFEYNSNASGDYTKFADGRMICTRKVNFALTPNTAWGALFITPLQAAQSFAATFITPPTIEMLLTLSNGYSGTGWLVGVGEPTTTTWPAFYIADIASRGITSFNIHYTANGRWF